MVVSVQTREFGKDIMTTRGNTDGISSVMSTTRQHILVFKGKIYEYGSIRLRQLLGAKDLWNYVEIGFADLDKPYMIQFSQELLQPRK